MIEYGGQKMILVTSDKDMIAVDPDKGTIYLELLILFRVSPGRETVGLIPIPPYIRMGKFLPPAAIM